ncbi:CPBP family glutamic-type intramembrane protease [Streptococcus ferus]|uniref:CPBP family glutamic-type intramembrane protease n=1 Tax=Streptococcus ferus TaxID=1345 RepID=UPI0035161F35
MKNVKNLILPTITWFLLFGLTVKLGLSETLFSLFPWSGSVIVGGCLLNMILSWLIVRKREELALILKLSDRKIWLLYLILFFAGITVPWHYHWELPIWQYLLFVTISVFWQNLVTFGVFQNALKQHLSQKSIFLLLPIVFLLGHIIFIPNFLTEKSPVVVVLTPVMALLFSYLKEKTGQLHWLIFIHLMFYFLTA